MLPPLCRVAHVAALAASLGAGHAAFTVAAWGGAAMLRRPVPGHPAHDLAGPYPLLAFDPAWNLRAGLAEMAAAGAASFVAVADPLHPPADPWAFAPCRPLRRHHLLLGPYAPSAAGRAELRRAARRCEVAERPLAALLPDWARLQAGLVRRKGLAGGLHDFAPGYAAALAALGLRAFAAEAGGRVVAMALFALHRGAAWYHLAAAEQAGRAAGAGHALLDLAIRTLRAEGVGPVALGGGQAGWDEPPCGLERFKAGFADTVRPALLLGAVLDPAACAALGAGRASAGWFPPYRAPPGG